MKFCFLTFGIVSAFLFGQEGRAQHAPSIVNPQNAPVQLVSITSKPDDMLSEMLIRNTSSETIASVKIGLIMSVPQGCGSKPYLGADLTTSRDVNIQPGQSFVLRDIGMSPLSVQHVQAVQEAKDVLSQVAIVSVRFVGGSTWQLDRKGKTFDDDLLAQNVALRCPTSASRRETKDGCHLTQARIKLAQGFDGGYYTCGSAAQQICSSGGDAYSCTSIACTNKLTCPNQM